MTIMYVFLFLHVVLLGVHLYKIRLDRHDRVLAFTVAICFTALAPTSLVLLTETRLIANVIALLGHTAFLCGLVNKHREVALARSEQV